MKLDDAKNRTNDFSDAQCDILVLDQLNCQCAFAHAASWCCRKDEKEGSFSGVISHARQFTSDDDELILGHDLSSSCSGLLVFFTKKKRPCRTELVAYKRRQDRWQSLYTSEGTRIKTQKMH